MEYYPQRPRNGHGINECFQLELQPLQEWSHLGGAESLHMKSRLCSPAQPSFFWSSMKFITILGHDLVKDLGEEERLQEHK